MEFNPTKEQIRIAELSNKRWAAGYFNTLFYSPYEWAVMCLQNEFVTNNKEEW